MTLAVATVVQRVRDLLGDTPWLTKYAGSTTTTADTTYDMPDGTRWDEGAIMEWQDGGAQDYVVSVNTNTVTIYQGMNGSTAVAHTATTYVVRDPFYTYTRIYDSINLTLQSLWPHVYKVTALADITPVTTQTWYDLATDFMAPIRVQQIRTDNATIANYGAHGSRLSVGWQKVPTSLCTSGYGLVFPNSLDNVTNAIKVTYAAKYTATVGTQSDYSDLSDGLIADTVVWGAAARLLQATDAARTNNTDINMGLSGVQSGERARIGRDFQRTYLDFRAQAAEELLRTDPFMEEGAAPLFSSASYAVRNY